MTKKLKLADVHEDMVIAYFDLEFCNERISRHNVPIAVGVSYQRGGEEIGNYYSLIWCGDEMELWREQLDNIGYRRDLLRDYGKPMEEVTGELMAAHEEFMPKMYVSFGKQDEDLLKKFVTQSLDGWEFCDAIQYLPQKLSMKYDISLEKYAYICHIDFIHDFDPLEDARSLAEIVWCVLSGQQDEERRQEVAEEYAKKMFLILYRNKQQAYDYLCGLEELTPKQQEKLHNHENYLKRNREQYLAYTEE
ncbi:MAG: hypothetical protein J6A92_01800 [Lachnospiraceae bacterium]|nr:hypothetical protein [Lachnospiraceae bacterium]